MAKSKTRRKKRGFTLPLAVAAPIAYVGYNTALYAMNQSPEVALDKLGYWMTGYSVKSADFNWNRMKGGSFPILGGIVVHKIASMLGVNRAIAQAGIPIIRI